MPRALNQVTGYCLLLKELPLTSLLGALDLESIRGALINIFNHLKRIRQTDYPTDRAAKVVQALSRDLHTQLIKVLGALNIMNLPYDYPYSLCSFSNKQ